MFAADTSREGPGPGPGSGPGPGGGFGRGPGPGPGGGSDPGSGPGPGRILAVDLGRRWIGLAVSDPLGLTAQGLPSLRSGRDPVEEVLGVCRDWAVAAVVVGLPLNLDGSRGPEAAAAEAFAIRLRERSGLPVEAWDERLSSVEAERALIEAGVRASRRRKAGLVDRGAATVILRSYLGRRPSRPAPESRS